MSEQSAGRLRAHTCTHLDRNDRTAEQQLHESQQTVRLSLDAAYDTERTDTYIVVDCQ